MIDNPQAVGGKQPLGECPALAQVNYGAQEIR